MVRKKTSIKFIYSFVNTFVYLVRVIRGCIPIPMDLFEMPVDIFDEIAIFKLYELVRLWKTIPGLHYRTRCLCIWWIILDLQLNWWPIIEVFSIDKSPCQILWMCKLGQKPGYYTLIEGQFLLCFVPFYFPSWPGVI